MSSLLVKSKVREFALAVAKKRFSGVPGYGKERVSEEFFAKREGELRALLRAEVEAALDTVVEKLHGQFEALITRAVLAEPASGKTLR